MIQLIIFDMDGLMFDTEAATCRAFLEVGTEWGLHPRKEQFIELLGLNSKDIIKKYHDYFGKDVDAESLYRQVGDRKMKTLEKEGIPIKKGLMELLKAIDKAGIKKAVASSSNQDVIEKNIRDAGLEGRFDYILSAKKVKRGKPFPDVFLEICQKLQADPEQTLVFEDSANGVAAALAGNLPVINVPDMVRIPPELARQCAAVVDSLEEAIPYLKQ